MSCLRIFRTHHILEDDKPGVLALITAARVPRRLACTSRQPRVAMSVQHHVAIALRVARTRQPARLWRNRADINAEFPDIRQTALEVRPSRRLPTNVVGRTIYMRKRKVETMISKRTCQTRRKNNKPVPGPCIRRDRCLSPQRSSSRFAPPRTHIGCPCSTPRPQSSSSSIQGPTRTAADTSRSLPSPRASGPGGRRIQSPAIPAPAHHARPKHQCLNSIRPCASACVPCK